MKIADLHRRDHHFESFFASGADGRAEQTEAAKCAGVSDLRFLGYPDGRLEPSLALRKDLARVIR